MASWKLRKFRDSEWLGVNMGTAPASWTLEMDGRPVAHLYRSGPQFRWNFYLLSNPYNIGSALSRDQAVSRIKGRIALAPDRAAYRVTGEIEDKLHDVEDIHGRLGVVFTVDWGRGDVWIAHPTPVAEGGSDQREFGDPASAIDWLLDTLIERRK